MSDLVSFDDDAGAQFVTDLERLRSTFEQSAQILDLETELSRYVAPGSLALGRYLTEVELDISFVSSVVQGFGGGPVPMSISEIAEELGISYSDAERISLGAELAELNAQIENWNGTDNDPILDGLIRDRAALIEELTGNEQTWQFDADTLAVAALNLISYEEADFAITTVAIDELAAQVDSWSGHPNDPAYTDMVNALNVEIDTLAEGDSELARLIRVQINSGAPASDAFFDGALDAFSDQSLSELMTNLESRGTDPETFDPVAIALQTAMLSNLETFTGADAADVNLGIAVMAQDSNMSYNGAVALLNYQIQSGDSEWPADTELFEFLDGPIESGEEAAFRMLADRSIFDELEHANGGWFGPDAKMSEDDWERVLENPGDFSPEAVAIATFFSTNPTAWQELDTARDGVALSNLANGEMGISNGDGTASWVDIEQYVTNQQLFTVLSNEMGREGSVLTDANNDGYLDENEFQIALENLDAAEYPGVQEALQFAIDADLMSLPDNRSFFEKVGDGVYTISSLTPLSPTGIYRMVTEPGELLDDQISFARGAGNAVIGLGQLAYDVSAMSPLSATYHIEAWRVDGDPERHRGIQMTNALPHLADSVLSLNPTNPQFWSELAEVRQQGTWDAHGGVSLVTETLDWQTFVDNPAEWAGQFVPDLIITAATGGGGAITRIGTTASRVTNTARRLLTTTRHLPDFNNLTAITRARTGLTNARHLANTTLDDIATTLFPQTGLSPAWADNVHLSNNTPNTPGTTGAANSTPNTPGNNRNVDFGNIDDVNGPRGDRTPGSDLDEAYVAFDEGVARLVGAETATIDPGKLTNYALDPTHPVGQHKARVFEAALGFNQSNADELIAQIRIGVQRNSPTPGLVDQHGSRFSVDIPVTGPSGSGTVRTAWIYDPGSTNPRLVTVVVK